MQLEDYFSFLDPNDIRIKGTRVGIETVLYDYIFKARTPEEIAQSYGTINLEQVYATILYYLHNKEDVDRYLTDWIEYGDKMRREQEANPSPFTLRMRALKAEKSQKQAVSP
ncbi:MAG: DUF433 domain-containing protein [Cyanobacteria bacterium J06623_5]